MIFRMELTHYETIDKLDKIYLGQKTDGCTSPPGIYESVDINSMLEFLFPNEVKVNITIDDIRLKSNLTTNKTIRFTKKSFFKTKIRFNQSH